MIVDAFRHAEASVVAPLRYTGLIWALVFGWMLWGHWPTLQQTVGAVLIVLGAVGVATRR